MTENVIPFPQRRPTKMAFAELAEVVASAMNFEQHMFPRPFPKTYRVVEPDKGVRLLLEETDGDVLTEVPIDHAAHAIMAWLRLFMNPEWFLTLRKAREAVEFFLGIAEPISNGEIKPVRWADEPGHTWRRLPWKRTQGGNAPTWEGLLARMTNAQAFIDWVGSSLCDKSNNHNYVWCQGDGGDGKGAINRFFGRVFARAYRSMQPPGMGESRFWTCGLRGARMVVFPDCNNRKFITSGLFKSMSGGDPLAVEFKGRMAFTDATIQAKYIFFSNENPKISHETADLRRLIYCKFEGAGEYSADFEDRLWEEGGEFLSHCVNQYEHYYPQHGAIRVDADIAIAIAAEGDEQFQVFFDAHFAVPAEHMRTKEQLSGLDAAAVREVTVTPAAMLELFTNQFGRDTAPYDAFRSWLNKKYKVTKVQFRANNYERRYIGICHKK